MWLGSMNPSEMPLIQRYQVENDNGNGNAGLEEQRRSNRKEKQKGHSEEWPNCLILLVPPRGIEPRPDDYKSKF